MEIGVIFGAGGGSGFENAKTLEISCSKWQEEQFSKVCKICFKMNRFLAGNRLGVLELISCVLFWVFSRLFLIFLSFLRHLNSAAGVGSFH